MIGRKLQLLLVISVFSFLFYYCVLQKNKLLAESSLETMAQMRDLVKKRVFHRRPRAVIVILCRNSERDAIAKTLLNFEDRFNSKFAYPYVFLNNEPFDEMFKTELVQVISKGSNAKVEFGLVPPEHWSYPPHIDLQRAAAGRRDLERRRVVYGGSESYRFMCRYFSGFFYRHPLLQKYEYYWRVEPGVDFACDINYDVFDFMQQNGKVYGFVISINEIMQTVPSLWKTVIEAYMPDNSKPAPPTLPYFGSVSSKNGYNGCHFWSNFEIASFSFYRSSEYAQYFETLDKAGGFFYERWGDAPVHSIAAGLFLRPEQMHYFDDIAYHHAPFSHCPSSAKFRAEHRCSCNPNSRFEASRSVCLYQWQRLFHD